MSSITKCLGLSAVLATLPQGQAENERHVIRLHADGHVLPGMQLLDVYEGERTKNGTLVSSGGVEFRTPKGKKFFLCFNEFSFVFNVPEPWLGIGDLRSPRARPSDASRIPKA